MKRISLMQLVNIIAFLATVLANFLANAIPFNGQTTGEVSDKFEVYFVPAGYVFSIWGLIYLGLLAFTIYQALPGQRDNLRLLKLGYLFAVSCLANIVWLLLWHYEQFALSVLLMLAILGSLIGSYLRLQVGKSSVSPAERWFVQLPFSIYLGWISVATIANITAFLDYIAWSGWGIDPAVWAVVMIIVGGVLAAMMRFRRNEVAFLLVVVWAFAGISVKQAATPVVAYTGWVCAGGLLLLLFVSVLFQRLRPLGSV